MKIKDIELANISRFRGELMGAAMLFIILFHVALPRENAFFGLRRMGNVGVDMFLFLSGIGLWFSVDEESFCQAFLIRRYLRIYPTWLIIACLFYIPSFQGGSTWNWIYLFGEITINWGFWLHDELNFWYIPATMMLYLFAPAYMELIKRHPDLPLAAGGDDHVVHPGTICHPDTSGCRTSGDFLEPRAYLLHRHQHG